MTVLWLKALLFGGALVYGSISDIRTREVPPLTPLLILLAGLLDCEPWPAVSGLLLMALVFYLAALAGLGGGDFWLMCACGFCLGPSGSIVQTIGGLSFAVVYALLRRLKYGRPRWRASIPLVPFLGAAGIGVFILQALGGFL